MTVDELTESIKHDNWLEGRTKVALLRVCVVLEEQAEEIAQLKAEKQQGTWGAEMQRSYPATDTVQP